MASSGVHILSGFALGTFAPSPPSAFAAGVVSHGVFDALPHREDVAWWLQAIEAGSAVALVVALAARLPRGPRARALAGAVGAVAPDSEIVACRLRLLRSERKLFPTHTGRIPHGRGGSAWTMGLSALSAAAAVVTVMHIRRRLGELD